MRMYLVFLVVTYLSFVLDSCHTRNNTPAPEVKPSPTVHTLSYTLVRTYPHDTTAFTEGLLIHNSKLFESTGATSQLPQTRSLFGIVDMSTGRISVKAELNKAAYFGEGITILHDKIYQLTYKNQMGFVYDARSFKRIGDFRFANSEGWGLTTDEKSLIMSDGTSSLTYLDPGDFHVIRTLPVSENGYERDHLNELEYVGGFVYANVWTTSTIVKIDTQTGLIVAKLDLSALESEANRRYSGSAEMNGVAYDPSTKHFFVTGKMWPTLYEIEVHD